MTDRPVLLASDVHLGAIAPEQEEAFLRWLAAVPDMASALVLNGDLFDFWFEFPSGIPRGYDRPLSVLREVVEAGVPVTLMGGNHDWWGGRYLREEIGVEFLQDPVERSWAGFRTLLAHGDGLGRGDLPYRFLRLVLRGRLTRWAFGRLGPDLGGRAAAWVSRTEDRWHAPEDETTKTRARALEAWAVALLRSRPDLDLVALGHTHIPVLREIEPGRWYLNTGDWVYNRTYAALSTGSAPELRHWER